MLRFLAATFAVIVSVIFVYSAQAQEPTPEATPTEEPAKLGDINCDRRINQFDATLVLQLDVGMVISDSCVDAGDINDDGALNTIDAALILQHSAGLTSFPPVPPDPLPPSASGALSIGSAEAGPEREGTVALEARAITAPGLGAWKIDVEYDPAVVSVVRCNPEQGAVCNGEFASGVLRLSGASSPRLEGDTKLANLTFQCGGVEGVSDLTLNPRIFADATLGGPQAFVPTVTNGSFTCAETARGRLTVFLIHDLNGNGRRDPREPGLEGWMVELPGFCGGDLAFTSAAPRATGADGRVVFAIEEHPGCFRAESRFGWFFTTETPRITGEGSRELEGLVLVRKVGQQLHQLTGALIVDGLPATEDARVEVVVNGVSCGDAQLEIPFGDYQTRYTLYVLGEADRPGCAAEGQVVEITVDGVSAADVIFAATSSSQADLMAGPSPMWFVEGPREGPAPVPYVGSLICGEAREQSNGFTPADPHTVYVLPDALRSGCGAPGRVVTLIAGDEVLRHVLWQEGFVPNESLQDVELPKTGAASAENAKGYGLQLSAALAAAGLLLLAGGALRWRVRRAA